jgi:ubiquinone/menaquinone biosynthesis C-methylase UbiE
MGNSYSDFAGFYDCLMNDFDYNSLAEYYNRLIQEQGITHGILLDLACGTGTLSVLMAEHGWDVIAVDSSPEMLCNAKPHDGVSYICQDMTELDLYGTINAAVCSLDGLNHLLVETALQKVLERVSLFMEGGGVFVFDVNTIYKHETILGNNTIVKQAEDVYCVWQNCCENNGIVDITLDIFEKFARKSAEYRRQSVEIREKAYELDTICKICERSGFDIVGRYDFMTNAKAHSKSEKVVFVCKKVR